METIQTAAEHLLGIDSSSLSWWQMGLRAGVVYVFAIFLVRLGDKRFFGKHTALDLILGFVLGSILSRAITGNSPFVPTLCASLLLVGMHWLFAVAAFRWTRFGTVVKGSNRQLISDGQLQWKQLKASHITRDDLMSAVRANGGTEDLDSVESAYLERSGNISVIKRSGKPRILEVNVEKGVQTIRVDLG